MKLMRISDNESSLGLYGRYRVKQQTERQQRQRRSGNNIKIRKVPARNTRVEVNVVLADWRQYLYEV